MISREIHDDLGQSLVTLKMLIQASIPDVSKKKILSYLDEIIEKARMLSTELRPSGLSRLGLQASLKSLIEEFENDSRIPIHYEEADLEGLAFYSDPINLYRILQEALTNIIKHARATHVSVSLNVSRGHLCLIIRDDGIGFEKRKKDIPPCGIGLSTMSERVQLLHGRMTIESAPDEGTTLTIDSPVRKS